jgi:hypothetical protein
MSSNVVEAVIGLHGCTSVLSRSRPPASTSPFSYHTAEEIIKNILFVLFALFAPWVTAHGEVTDTPTREKVPLGFKVISVKDNSQQATGVRIAAKDIQKGVFITATGGWSTTYPKTSKLLRDIFKSKGIKVVDKPEDADIGLMFLGGDNFGNFDEVENDLDSLPPKVSTPFAILLSTIYAAATHGNLPSIRGKEFDAKKNAMADVVIVVAKNPKLTSRGKVDGDDKKTIDSEISFHLDRRPADSEQFALTLLKADVSQFIDQHFDGTPVPADVAPASSVAPASAVSAASAPAAPK